MPGGGYPLHGDAHLYQLLAEMGASTVQAKCIVPVRVEIVVLLAQSCP